MLSNYPVKRRVVRGLAHITGEGLEGNVPRVLPAGRRVVLHKGSWEVPPVFGWLQRLGNVDEAEMSASLSRAADPQDWLAKLEELVLMHVAARDRARHDNFSGIAVWVGGH